VRNRLFPTALPQWGNHPLDTVKAVAIEAWLKTLWLPECKRWPRGKRMSAGGKKKIRDLMHVLFQHAMRYEWIDRNPISLVRQSGKREEIPTVLNLEQLARLIYVALGLRERTMVLLDFTSGMRRGELSGVKWISSSATRSSTFDAPSLSNTLESRRQRLRRSPFPYQRR
jgi:integrase